MRPAKAVPALRLLQGGTGDATSTAEGGTGRAARLASLLLTRRAVEPGIEAAGRRDGARLGLIAAVLTCFGTVMVLSASPVTSITDYGSPFSLFERQLLWVLLGAIAYAVALHLDLRRIRRLARPALYLALFLLLAVLVPHLGKAAGGSSRWIGAGPIRLQPSELSKLCFALFCADLVARRQHARDQLREIVRPLAIVLAFACILILKQPDMGTAIVVVCIATGVLYAGGVQRRLLAAFAAVLAVGGSVLALSASYRRARLLSFVNPFGHASTTGYQVVQSLVSLGSGHLAGVGIGGSIAKWYLPNAETDFIFAVVGNDFGLLGAIAVLAAFAAFACYGVRIAARTKDRFASLFATAIICWVVLQAIVNIGGVVGALPETGIPLPFLSSGGSSLVVVLCATGLLVNIARHPRLSTDAAGTTREPRTTRTTPATRRAPAGQRRPPVGAASGRAAARSTAERRRAASGGGR